MRYVSLQQLLQIKPLHAYWVIKTHNIMSQCPELIKRGFRKVGLSLLNLYMLAGIEIYTIRSFANHLFFFQVFKKNVTYYFIEDVNS